MDFVELRGFTSEQSTILLCTNLVKQRKLKSDARANLVKQRNLKSDARANLVKQRKSGSGFQCPHVDLVKQRKSTSYVVLPNEYTRMCGRNLVKPRISVYAHSRYSRK